MEEQKERYRHLAQPSQGQGEVNQNHKRNMKVEKTKPSTSNALTGSIVKKGTTSKPAGVIHGGPKNSVKSKGKTKKD